MGVMIKQLLTRCLISAPLQLQVAIAIVLAIAVGSITPADSALYELFRVVGKLFLQALKMVVVPVIIASMINAITDVSATNSLGVLGTKAFVYMVVSTTLATLTGILFVNTIAPGKGSEQLLDGLAGEVSTATGSAGSKVVESLLSIVPSNVVSAAANNDLLAIIFFSILFGYCINHLKGEQRTVMTSFWKGMYTVVMAITTLVLRVAPIGIFGLIASLISSTGFASFVPMLSFFLTVVLALAFHFLVTYSLFLKFIVKVNPLTHLRAVWPAVITAFSTASSAATVPVSITCARERVGISNRVSGFFIPMGSTINMDGTALYECTAVLFIAQLFGIELSIVDQLLVVFLALATSIGVAGVPAASLVAMGIILAAVGLPLESISVLIITDRILDMMRTSVNVYGDSVGSAVIAKTEGESLYTVSPVADKPDDADMPSAPSK